VNSQYLNEECAEFVGLVCLHDEKRRLNMYQPIKDNIMTRLARAWRILWANKEDFDETDGKWYDPKGELLIRGVQIHTSRLEFAWSYDWAMLVLKKSGKPIIEGTPREICEYALWRFQKED
jgi:hypothetical protein